MMKFVSLALAFMACAAATPSRSAREGCTACGGCKYKEQCEDEAPEDLKCVWAPKVPGQFEEADYACQTRSCLTLNGEEDSNGNPQAVCQSMSECDWNEEAYACIPKGGKVPCEMVYADPESGQQCPVGCTYNKVIMKCLGTGDAVPCDEIYDQEQCSGSCKWHDDIYKCWPVDKDVPCIEYEYMMQEDCPTECKWQETGHGTYSTEEGRCMEKDEVMACEEVYEKDQCSAVSDDRCEWHAEGFGLCMPKGRAVPCEKFGGESCSESTQCHWTELASQYEMADMGACSDCATPGESCVQKWSGPSYGEGGEYGEVPDDGKPCADHDDMCPEPRCFASYDEDGPASGDTGGCGGGADTGFKCREPLCSDLEYDEDQCKSLAPAGSCTYDTDSGACYNPTATTGFPCRNFYSKTECETGIAAGKCTFYAFPGEEASDDYGVCYTKGSELGCRQMEAYDETACESGPQAKKCVWHENIYECLSADYVPPCTSYTNEAECPSDRCEKIQGICWTKGEPIVCNAFCSAFQCDATEACAWSTQDYKCSACPKGSNGEPDCGSKNAACDTFKSDETCPEAHCEFMYFDDNGSMDDMKGECTDKVCTEVYDEAECAATVKGRKACNWTPGEYAGSGHCAPVGLSLPCNTYYGTEECGKAQGCTWDADVQHCNEQGQKSPCMSYYEPTSCPADCKWDESNYSCLSTASASVTDESKIMQHGTGTGNQDEAQCSTEDFAKLKPYIEQADQECVTVGRRLRKDGERAPRATNKQVECLEYFLEQGSSSITKACPCLWAWGKEIDVYQGHWMELNC